MSKYDIFHRIPTHTAIAVVVETRAQKPERCHSICSLLYVRDTKSVLMLIPRDYNFISLS